MENMENKENKENKDLSPMLIVIAMLVPCIVLCVLISHKQTVPLTPEHIRQFVNGSTSIEDKKKINAWLHDNPKATTEEFYLFTRELSREALYKDIPNAERLK